MASLESLTPHAGSPTPSHGVPDPIHAVAYPMSRRVLAGTGPVLKDWAHTQAGFHLYVPTREQTPPKVRALLYFLVEKRDATRLD